MKYSETRNWTHPVHRSGFDDWPNDEPPEMLATLDWNHGSESKLKVEVKYQPNQRTILEAIERGNAVCTGLVYEPRSLFRTQLKSSDDVFTSRAVIDIESVGDSITVHPAIVAAKTFELSTKDAHSEYEGVPITIRKGAPIAIVPSYGALLPKRVRPPESVVKFKTDKTLEDGKFCIDTNPTERDIFIRANEETKRKWKELSSVDKSTALASLYLAAFTQAFAEIAVAPSDDDIDHSDTWKGALSRSLENSGQQLKIDDDSDGVPAAEAAQLVLKFPFGHLFDHRLEDVE